MERLKNFVLKYYLWGLCALIFVVMGFIKPQFVTADNLYGLMSSMMSYGVLALGLSVALIGGENNISIGSVLAFSGVVFAALIGKIGLLLAFIVAVFLSTVLGMINGWLVAYKKMPAFLVAVAFMISVRGLALAVSKSQNIIIDNELFGKISRFQIGPVPILFVVLIILAIIIDIVLRNTTIGRDLFAVGGNAEVADYSGINVRLYKMLAIAFSSLMAGIGGVFLTTRLSSAIPSVGEDAIITVLSIVVLGGTSMQGGKGSAIGTLSGLVFMYALFNLMSMFNIYVNVQSLIKGVVLLSVVVGGKYIENRNRKI